MQPPARAPSFSRRQRTKRADRTTTVYTTARHHASPIPSYPTTTKPSYRDAALLVSVLPGRLVVSSVGLTERQGNASQDLAEALAPELAALDRAARRLAGVQKWVLRHSCCCPFPWSPRGGRRTVSDNHKRDVDPVGALTRYPLALPPILRLWPLTTQQQKCRRSHFSVPNTFLVGTRRDTPPQHVAAPCNC